MTERERLQFIFINGRTSAGKDTQVEILEKEIPDSIRLSTGDIYRGARTPGGEYGQFHPIVAPYVAAVDAGQLLPMDVVIEMAGAVIEDEIGKGRRAFIFTGFPRSIEQVEKVDEYLERLGSDFEVQVGHVCIAVTESLAKERARIRRSQAVEKGETPRSDDMEEALDKRMEQYSSFTGPMFHHLANQKRLKIVRGDGTVNDVRSKIAKALSHES